MTPRFVLWGTLIFIALYCSCQNYSHVHERVDAVRVRTVPSDANGLITSGPSVNMYSATAHWEFDTSEEKRAYFSWTSQQLQLDDFISKLSAESSLIFIKNREGEAESVEVRPQSSNGNLHVKITYVIDSD
jgi:hypothetical protein